MFLFKVFILPELASIVVSLEELRNKMYPNVSENYVNPKWLPEREILDPKKDMVNVLIQQLPDEIPYEKKTFNSVDSDLNDEQVVYNNIQDLELPGMPTHQLKLKDGCSIMFLRNFNAIKLCYGTRLCISFMHRQVIEAVILTGMAEIEQTFSPRVHLIPSDSPIKLKKKLQFLFRVSSGITTNSKYNPWQLWVST